LPLEEDMSDQWGYTVEEVAAVLKVSKHTVLRRAKELGAVQIAGNEGSIKVRRYRVLRFPRASLEKYLTKLSGSPVVLTSLTIPQTRRARANWEETATRKLAEIASANSEGVPERAVFARIARNARTLCFVNREEWKDVEFVEGED
jgi:ribosomal protein L15E